MLILEPGLFFQGGRDAEQQRDARDDRIQELEIRLNQCKFSL